MGGNGGLGGLRRPGRPKPPKREIPDIPTRPYSPAQIPGILRQITRLQNQLRKLETLTQRLLATRRRVGASEGLNNLIRSIISQRRAITEAIRDMIARLPFGISPPSNP